LEQLICPIKKALGTTNIKRGHIEPDAFQFANKGGISRLLLAAISGCKGLKEMEAEMNKQRQR
tara:strand:- start:207 stop:395 length:189 start_codon:yes stop_codon:yes gene_type:complete